MVRLTASKSNTGYSLEYDYKIRCTGYSRGDSGVAVMSERAI